MTDERLIAESWECATVWREKAGRCRERVIDHAMLGAFNATLAALTAREGSAWVWFFGPLAALGAATVLGSLVLRRDALRHAERHEALARDLTKLVEARS